ncbi:MAG TPA: biopolymer transporter ExbD [Polyangiaceae bacterium]|jgi:biopolymer transport protein TolR|nr:biopolymer transporter ExbD [Polyangiaceae bacterium]
MGASVGRGGRRRFRDINVTPLVDVMLVLLVVFMVTAPLLTTGLKIDLPNVKAPNTPVEDERLIVTITAEGKVMFDDKEVTGHAFEEFQVNPKVQATRELYIRADKSALYGVVAEVVAAARRSGVDSLNLLVQPDETPETPAKNESPK